MVSRTRQRASAPQDSARRQSDIAYERLLENLFDRRLPAGAFVSQSELVDLLGIPVAPLRDALRVLETEGVLKIHPRSGIEFVKPGLELTKSTYQYRTIIERAAVRVFAETAGDDLIAGIAAAHEALVAAIESDGLDDAGQKRLGEMESLLHDNIVAILKNPLIETSHRRMHNYLKLVRLERRITAPLALRSLQEHLEIINACAKRNADAAEEAVREHFALALQRHMGIF